MEEFVDVIAKGNIVEHSERSGRGGDEAVVGPVLARASHISHLHRLVDELQGCQHRA